MDETEILPGVRALEHTADLALEIRGASLAQLFDRAATGMFALIEGDDEEPVADVDVGTAPPPPARFEADEPAERRVAVEAPDLPALLVGWLRELLYLYQVERLAYRGAAFEALEPEALRARVRCEPVAGGVREIKGVTYHGLEVSRRNGDWHARVVFDV